MLTVFLLLVHHSQDGRSFITIFSPYKALVRCVIIRITSLSLIMLSFVVLFVLSMKCTSIIIQKHLTMIYAICKLSFLIITLCNKINIRNDKGLEYIHNANGNCNVRINTLKGNPSLRFLACFEFTATVLQSTGNWKPTKDTSRCIS